MFPDVLGAAPRALQHGAGLRPRRRPLWTGSYFTGVPAPAGALLALDTADGELRDRGEHGRATALVVGTVLVAGRRPDGEPPADLLVQEGQGAAPSRAAGAAGRGAGDGRDRKLAVDRGCRCSASSMSRSYSCQLDELPAAGRAGSRARPARRSSTCARSIRVRRRRVIAGVDARSALAAMDRSIARPAPAPGSPDAACRPMRVSLAGLAVGLATVPAAGLGAATTLALLVILLNRLIGRPRRRDRPSQRHHAVRRLSRHHVRHGLLRRRTAGLCPRPGLTMPLWAALLLASFVCTASIVPGPGRPRPLQRGEPDDGARGPSPSSMPPASSKAPETIIAFVLFCLFPRRFPWLAGIFAVLVLLDGCGPRS